MRIVAYHSSDGPRFGQIEDDVVVDLGSSLFGRDPSGRRSALQDVVLRSPVQPSKIVAVGLNYRDHALEGGHDLPTTPMIFAKFPSAVIGPGDEIRIPRIASRVDFEAELAVVIGKTTRSVTASDALTRVFGYTCLNDVSERSMQRADGQFVRAKSLDTFCPVGPWIVTADEIPDPNGLAISCRVNGRTMQRSSTADMVFPVAELIEFISQAITLLPGDVIATGTPAGVGSVRNPPVFLKHGDVVAVEIESIGILENPVVEEERLFDRVAPSSDRTPTDAHA